MLSVQAARSYALTPRLRNPGFAEISERTVNALLAWIEQMGSSMFGGSCRTLAGRWTVLHPASTLSANRLHHARSGTVPHAVYRIFRCMYAWCSSFAHRRLYPANISSAAAPRNAWPVRLINGMVLPVERTMARCDPAT